MILKYQEEIDKFECDLSQYIEIEIESFRWTYEDIDDIRNFEPTYINNPGRKKEDCLGFALSFFTTKAAGIKRLKEITLDKEHLFKKLGTHIAIGQLEKTDGLAGLPDEVNHFDFFLYENVELKNKFTVLESIV